MNLQKTKQPPQHFAILGFLPNSWNLIRVHELIMAFIQSWMFKTHLTFIQKPFSISVQLNVTDVCSQTTMWLMGESICVLSIWAAAHLTEANEPLVLNVNNLITNKYGNERALMWRGDDMHHLHLRCRCPQRISKVERSFCASICFYLPTMIQNTWKDAHRWEQIRWFSCLKFRDMYIFLNHEAHTHRRIYFSDAVRVTVLEETDSVNRCA